MSKKHTKEEKKYKTPDGDEYEPAQPKKKEIDPNAIPYPDKGGHSVQQLVEMNAQKRAAVLGEKNTDFEKEYLK